MRRSVRGNCVRGNDGNHRAARRRKTHTSGIDAWISISGWRSPSPGDGFVGSGASVRVVSRTSWPPYGFRKSSKCSSVASRSSSSGRTSSHVRTTRRSRSQKRGRTRSSSESTIPMHPMLQATASNPSSPCSRRTSRPPDATRSIARTSSGNGPKPSPDPCVDVATTPAIAWPS